MIILERILTQTQQIAFAFWAWLSSRSLNVRDWDTVTWQAAVITLLSLWLIALLITRPSKTSKRSKNPELMVSKGEVRQREGGTAQILSLKVSNLNKHSVQLLEITLKSDLTVTPLVIDAAELLNAGEAVELEAPLPKAMSGDNGTVNVFAFVPHSKKLYCLRCHFEWEAWAFRYKISPLGQTFKRVKRLESAEISRLRKRAWFERHTSPAARAFDEVVDTSYRAPTGEQVIAVEPEEEPPATKEPDDIMQLLEAKPQPSTLVNIPPVSTPKPDTAQPDSAQPDSAQPDAETNAAPRRAPQSQAEPRREFPKDF